jgi:hypothetical protein
VLHTLLSGRNEFSAKEVSTTIMRVLEHTPTPLDRVRNDVSPELAAVVARSMSKDPAERYATAADLAAALREVRGITESDANELMRQSAMRDFRDERFARLLHIDDLSVLERALNEEGDELELTAQLPAGDFETDPSLSSFASVEIPTRVTPAPATDFGEPTRAAKRRPPTTETPPANSTESVDTLPPPPEPRRTWPLIAAMIFAALIIGGGVIVASILFSQGSKEPAQVIVVDQKKQGQQSDPDNDGVGKTEDTGTTADAGAGKKPDNRTTNNKAGTAKKPPKKFNMQRAIDTAMAKRSGAFQSCFQSHPELSRKVRKVNLKIQVAASGRVSSASVAEGSVASAPLGKCLVKVARATAFGKLPKAIGFSIPLQTNVR